MQSLFTSGSSHPIGIEIAGRTIRAAQVSRRGKRNIIRAATVLPRRAQAGDLEPQEAVRLMETLVRQGFEGNDIIVSIPREKQLVTELVIPEDREGSIDELARRDFTSVYGEGLGGLELAWWRLPAHSRALREQHVRVSACTYADSEHLLDCFEYAGCSPRSLDSASFAVARTFEARGISLLTALDIDWTSSHLVVARDGFVIFERSIPGTGLRDLRAAMTADVTIDDFSLDCVLNDIGFATPDAGQHPLPTELIEAATPYFNDLAREVRNSLDYISDSYPDVGQCSVRLIGEGSTVPGLAESLGNCLQMEVCSEPVNASATPARGLETTCATGELTTALGLALYDG